MCSGGHTSAFFGGLTMSKTQTSVVPFSYKNSNIRTTTKPDGSIWFVAKDVCDILDIKNATQAIGNLDNDERSMKNIGRQGKANIISESGLYALIMRSNKPEAKLFRKWVTSEVLPAICKTGSYTVATLTPAQQRKVQQAVAEKIRRSRGHGTPSDFAAEYSRWQSIPRSHNLDLMS